MMRLTRFGRTMADISAYLGFAVRSGKIVYGIDNIIKCSKRMYALVVCGTASENLADKARLFSQRRHIPMIVTETALEDILHKRNCKAIALLDYNLAKAAQEANGR